MKKRSIIIALGLIIILIATTIVIVPMIRDTSSNDSSNEQIVEDSTAQDDSSTNTATTNTQTNTPESNIPEEKPSAEIEVPADVQQIITEHQDELYEDNSNLLATGYPSNLVPLYNATMVSESQLITSASGNPGWLTSYVSEKSTEELTNFYRSLLSDLPNFTEETISETTNFSAISGAYSIHISISPNIQEKSDLPGNSAISIYIEQIG